MSTGRAAATMAAGRMGRWLAELAGTSVVAPDRRRPEAAVSTCPPWIASAAGGPADLNERSW
jgi:hypothetical protein